MLGPFIALVILEVVGFLPGWLALNALPERVRRHVAGEHVLPLSFAFSFVLIALVHLGTFLAGSPRGSTDLMVAGLLVLLLALRLLVTRTRPSLGEWQWLPAQALLLLLFLLFLVAWPSYAAGWMADHRYYYPNTDLLLGRTSVDAYSSGLPLEYLAKRTPLLSLYGSFFLSFLGQSYATFQVAGLVANGLVFWPVALLARTLLGPRARVFALLLLAISPAMARAVATPEPKLAGVGLVLLAFHLHLLARRDASSERRNVRSAVAGVLAVAAVATHPSMLFYAGWIFVDQAVLRARRRADLRPTLWTAAVAAALILLGPWTAWLASSLGPRAAFMPSGTVSVPAGLTPGRYLASRMEMAVTTALVPRQLVLAWRVPKPDPADREASAYSDGYRESARLRYYQDTYLGGLTTAVGAVLLCLGLRKRPRDAIAVERRLPYIWALLGAACCFAVDLQQPDTSGNALNMTAPLFVLALVAAAHVVAALPGPARALVLAVAVLETVYVRVSIFTFTAPWGPDFEGSVYDRIGEGLSGAGLAMLAMTACLVAVAFACAVVLGERSTSHAGSAPQAPDVASTSS